MVRPAAWLQGRRVHPERPGITIAQVRETDEGIVLAVRWDTVPSQAPATTWLRCSEREPELVRQLVCDWVFRDQLEHDDARVSDVEPPDDEPCGGWLAPDGRLWRCSDMNHRLVATRIVRALALPVGSADPQHWLETHGWVVVLGGSAGPGAVLTKHQQDTLFDLALRYPTMRDGIMRALRRESDG